MPVLAALQSLFEAIAGSRGDARDLPAAKARAIAHGAMEQLVTGYYAEVAPLPHELDHVVPVSGGEIIVRIYAPDDAREPLPCYVYFHGGGFWLGTLEHFDPLCRAVARDVCCAVASVGYRLAPEHRFPTATQDCYAALLWIAGNADRLGIDRKRLAVGGVSAGGTLATVVAMMARDRKEPALSLQILEVPITDLSTDEPLRHEEGVILPSGKDTYCRHYLTEANDALHPHVSPLLAPDLSGLPPALIMCAEYDPLAAEGKAFALKLAACGVPVWHICWPGQFHGAQAMAKLIPEQAAAYHGAIVSALKGAFFTA